MATHGVRDSYARDHLSHSLYQRALNIFAQMLKKQSTIDVVQAHGRLKRTEYE
jgi:hypothetical protein